MTYEGYYIPQDYESESAIPFVFAHFIVCENADSMSHNQTGAFHLYFDDSGVMPDNHAVPVLLTKFTEQAKTDDAISDQDVTDAAEWVNDFEEFYGEQALFYFR